jgi:hypothetical protein
MAPPDELLAQELHDLLDATIARGAPESQVEREWRLIPIMMSVPGRALEKSPLNHASEYR